MKQAEEKISFILYSSYEAQINLLTDEQAGKLLRGVFQYVRTGEQISQEPMVDLMLSVIVHQLDLDRKKYEEKIERRSNAAKKAGKASAEKRAQEKRMLAEAEKQAPMEAGTADIPVDNFENIVDNYVDNCDNSVENTGDNFDESVDNKMEGWEEENQTFWTDEILTPTAELTEAQEKDADRKTGMEPEQAADEFDEMPEQVGEDGEFLAEYGQRAAVICNERRRFQHEYVDVDEYEDEDVDDDEDVDEDGDEKIILKNHSCCCYRRRGRSAGAREAVQQELVFYGEDQIPTTEAELAQMEQLARELFDTYLHKKPTGYDYERVFQRTYRVCHREDEQSYAAYSREKADLLRHAFQTATDQNRLTWRYLDGIYDNYEQYGVTTLEEALDYEKRWNRGELA